MAMLNRSDWFDLARTTNWTPSYVSKEELFPPWLSDPFGMSDEQWEKFDEPFKVSYREYVKVQRDKDLAAYAVKSALQRTELYDKTDDGWKSVLKFHYGSIPVPEYNSASRFARIARFGRAPGMRNVATFGCLDEIRHAQIQLSFAHELIARDATDGAQYRWAAKAYLTDHPVMISIRRLFDDVDNTRDVTSTSVMATTVLETGFTNLQFVGLSADAARAGDPQFSTLIQSIQSDEARHSQVGQEVLKVMMNSGRGAEAQRLIDVSFWLSWRQFAVLTGVSMDYYTPVAKREKSFKEFMNEWVTTQFDRQILDLGLERPWYWDLFLRDIEEFHHQQHLSIWLRRNMYFWNPTGGVSPEERAWLEVKYPGWNASFGKAWDLVIENLVNGAVDQTFLEAPPAACHISHLPITWVPGQSRSSAHHMSDYEGRRYHFGSIVDKWIFDQDPLRYKGRFNLAERFFNGTIQPPTIEGLLAYIGMANEVGLDNYRWVEEYRESRAAGGGVVTA
jgi:toluene monooxygenase system protein A